MFHELKGMIELFVIKMIGITLFEVFETEFAQS